MAQLVFLETGIKKEPYTLSSIIAEALGYKHHGITKIIRRYAKDFEGLATLSTGDVVTILGSDLTPIEVTIGEYDSGVYGQAVHKVEGLGRPEKHYILSEEQATLLITYLRNTDKVRAFKKELVRQFFKMRKELNSLKGAYQETKPTQNALHRAIANHPKYKERRQIHPLLAGQNIYLAKLASRGRADKKGDLTAQELQEYERLEHLAIYNLTSGLSISQSNKALKEAIKKQKKQVVF